MPLASPSVLQLVGLLASLDDTVLVTDLDDFIFEVNFFFPDLWRVRPGRRPLVD